MPEGPQIRRAANRIASVLEGRAFLVPPCGMALLIRFEHGVTMCSYNQLCSLPARRSGCRD